VNAATHVDGTVNLTAPESCTSCHGTAGRASVAAADANQAAAPPADSKGNTAATAAGVGAHLAHVNQARATPLSRPFSCATCHPVPTQNLHANGISQVAFTGIAVTGGVTTSYASPGCSGTYCHGNFTGGTGVAAPAWNASGTQLGCTSCHGSPPGPTSAALHHPQNPDCTACHPGYTASSVAAATHVDGAVQKPIGCTACHGDLTATGVGSGDVRAAPAGNASAVDTRGNPATATAQRGIGAHQKHLTGTTWRASPIACSECHAVPAAGDETHVNGAPAVAFGALARTAWAGQPAIAPVWNGAGGGTNLTCASTYCHGNFRNGASAAPTWAAPSAVACGSCHGVSATSGPGGTHPAIGAGQDCGTCHGGSYTNTSVDPALHMNGQLDGGGESAGGSACGGCHADTFASMNGTTTRPFKHALGNVPGTNDSPSVGTADWTLAGNLAGAVAPAGRSCANMCHGDHPHGGAGSATHEFNVYLDAGTAAARGAAASAATRDDTDFDAAAANGGLCVSCHLRPIDGTAGRVTVTGPGYAGTGHDYVQNTVGGTTYAWTFAMHDGGLFRRNCTKCHAGGAGEDQAAVSGTGLGAVHSGDNDSLLMGSSVPAGGTSSVATFVCFKCHGTATAGTAFPMNRSGADVYLEAQKAQGHGGAAASARPNLNNDARHATLAEASAAFGGTAFAGAGRHVNCLDCHDPHESGRTGRSYAAAADANRNRIPAGSPITGATGVQYGTAAGAGKSYPALPASGSWPGTAAANYGTSVTRATYEYEVCFKCHTGFAFGATPPAAAATPSGQAETDLGLELSPSMRSGHPVVSPLSGYANSPVPKPLVAAQLSAPFNTAMGAQTMTCTDCHTGDAVSPGAQGPHGSAVTFMLRGPNQTWPGTFTLATSGANAYNAGAGTAAGLFCLNCHPLRTGTTWANNVHSRNNHSSRTCVTCHILVPHGGKVSRLIAAKGTGTSTLPARYDGGSAVTQFRKATSPTTYDKPNCNTSCGGHGTVTTPETW
jgi:predicted CxxxxCH...CXXCH cytochrome family protein